jgi:hypothetical protein
MTVSSSNAAPKSFCRTHAANRRDQNDEAGLERLRRIYAPDVARPTAAVPEPRGEGGLQPKHAMGRQHMTGNA